MSKQVRPTVRDLNLIGTDLMLAGVTTKRRGSLVRGRRLVKIAERIQRASTDLEALLGGAQG